jgi:hypothetical protein
MHPAALSAFIEQRNAGGPQRQVRRKLNEWTPRIFLKCNDTARAHQLRHRAQNGHGIGKKLENVPADDCIERPVAWDLCHIAFYEAHIVQTRFNGAGLRTCDRACVAFYPDDFSIGADQTSGKHCYVSDARSEIKDALTRTDARLAKETLGDRREAHRLSNEALVLCIGVAKQILGHGYPCYGRPTGALSTLRKSRMRISFILDESSMTVYNYPLVTLRTSGSSTIGNRGWFAPYGLATIR